VEAAAAASSTAAEAERKTHEKKNYFLFCSFILSRKSIRKTQPKPEIVNPQRKIKIILVVLCFFSYFPSLSFAVLIKVHLIV